MKPLMLRKIPYNCCLRIHRGKIHVGTRLLLTILLMAPALAAARNYKVEVLVFENVGKHRAYESYNYKPIEQMSAGAGTWLLEPGMLLKEASAIAMSDDYRLISVYSWGQESLPLSEAGAVRVDQAGLNGWIKIYANQLLYANLDLDFNGYRMLEKRRLKLDEKHFFDHPKFGILMQVSRLEPPEEIENEKPADEEPQNYAEEDALSFEPVTGDD